MSLPQAAISGIRQSSTPRQMPGLPHLNYTGEELGEIVARAIDNKTQVNTPVHHRFTQYALNQGGFDPGAVAEQAEPQHIEPVPLELHPNIEDSNVVASAPIEIASGVSAFDLIAVLAPGLPVAEARAETQLVGGMA
ncbi:MAG: hypothetical protein KJ732_03065 [Candidatus Margulisbacteria bacterium]|nr:hypothetical protein [Candidatus Margulisiibacteriota bacterium]